MGLKQSVSVQYDFTYWINFQTALRIVLRTTVDGWSYKHSTELWIDFKRTMTFFSASEVVNVLFR